MFSSGSTSNQIPKIQQDIDKVVDFMRKKPETESNIIKFKAMLRDLGDSIIIVSSYQTPDEMMHLSIAARAFQTKKLKPKFLGCILEALPESLYGEYLTTPLYTIQLLTPLRMSIKNRNLDMVQTVLNNPVFAAYMEEDIKSASDQLFRAYMWAHRWYDETNDKRAMTNFARNQDISAGEVREMFENQAKILTLLLEQCKKAMVIAHSQGKPVLSKALLHTFLFDGIGGEAFTLHDKPQLLSAQANRMIEICGACFPNETELSTAKAQGLIVTPEAIIGLVNLRLQIFKQETTGNIKELQNSLIALSKILPGPVLIDLLNVTGRGRVDNEHHIVATALHMMPLWGFAKHNGKTKFAKCIKDFEASLKEPTVDAVRLQQTALTPPISQSQASASQQALSTTSIPTNEVNPATALAVIVFATAAFWAICTSITGQDQSRGI